MDIADYQTNLGKFSMGVPAGGSAGCHVTYRASVFFVFWVFLAKGTFCEGVYQPPRDWIRVEGRSLDRLAEAGSEC